MAARFVFQKFSGMSRSTSLLGPLVSASAARAGPLVTRTAPNISNALRGAALRPGMAFPNNHGISAFQAARFPCPRPAAAETSWTTTGMPSIIMNRTSPTFVDSVAGSKRGLSSTAPNKHKPSEKAKIAPQKRIHDFTPSLVLNSLVNLFMGLLLVAMINDN